ncbi:phospholipid scramblase-related protein [Spirillospora sp. NPDC047279]|uniref:phospholipid scramblase-related protein n=1 Tax=Spirillospora sp. NPDC047279 TaxID=3155478 RepID=UPI0033F81BEC
MSDLFESPVLRVEQPRKAPLGKTQYKVLDGKGTLLAVATETTDRTPRESLKTMFPGKSEMDAHLLEVCTTEGDPLYYVDKAQGRMLTAIRRPDGELVGAFRTERVGRLYTLRDDDNKRFGEIEGDVPRRNFTVKNADGVKVAQIQKKWAGIATHLLTTADRYTVDIKDPVPEPLRTMAVLTAIVMDMFLHESKDFT